MGDGSRSSRSRCATLAVGALLALTACGSPGQSAPASSGSAPSPSGPPSSTPTPTTQTPTTPSPTAPSPSASAGPGDPVTFCTELKANGATGASFGAIPTFYRKKQLLADVGEKLTAMGDATPPREIAKPWALQKKTLRQIQAAAKKLPDGGMLSDPRYGPDATLDRAQDTLTDYWFAHCR